MGQATTTSEGFDTVAQAGSGITWSGLSNMPYPTEGEATASLTAGTQNANTINLQVPQEAANIPVGSTFDEMALSIKIKKSGTFSASTNTSWSGRINLGLSGAWSSTQTADEAYQTLNISGDRSFWRLTGYTPAAIIEKLQDGTMYHKVDVSTVSAVACNVLIKTAVITITYTTTEGKRGALIAALV